ncbi:MAG TPA: YdcF family protein [Longimicrobiales bacterium]
MRLNSGRVWLALIGWLVGGTLVIWAMSVLLILYTGARPVIREADAILVLGAAQYNGRPSPVLKARLDHAIDLFDQGLAKTMVFTGGVGAGDTVSEGEVARRYALKRDVPASAILVERHGLTSAESVAAAAALMRAKGLRSALVVSDSYHMLRLELLVRRAGIRPYRAPAASPIDRARRTRLRYVLRESVLFPATAILGGK